MGFFSYLCNHCGKNIVFDGENSNSIKISKNDPEQGYGKLRKEFALPYDLPF